MLFFCTFLRVFLLSEYRRKVDLLPKATRAAGIYYKASRNQRVEYDSGAVFPGY
jgi:hypothetical protein